MHANNGMQTRQSLTTHARHLPHNNTENMNTLYNISDYNRLTQNKNTTIRWKQTITLHLVCYRNHKT